MFAKSDSLSDLALKMKLPPASLIRTVHDYNRAVKTGSDPFGRRHLPMPLTKAPFYAVECLGSAIFSQVGLDINGDLQVLTRRKQPIAGLYAVGEVTGGWHTNGNVVINGGSVTPAITFGRYLGMTLPIKN
jgi:fumarate reductase flavoprotein subunit